MHDNHVEHAHPVRDQKLTITWSQDQLRVPAGAVIV